MVICRNEKTRELCLTLHDCTVLLQCRSSWDRGRWWNSPVTCLWADLEVVVLSPLKFLVMSRLKMGLLAWAQLWAYMMLSCGFWIYWSGSEICVLLFLGLHFSLLVSWSHTRWHTAVLPLALQMFFLGIQLAFLLTFKEEKNLYRLSRPIWQTGLCLSSSPNPRVHWERLTSAMTKSISFQFSLFNDLFL